MFVGRQNELDKLNGLYDKGNFECVVVHGRLRMGKTSLLREFVKDKKHVYVAAQETNSRENLHYLATGVEKFSHGLGIHAQGISNYEGLFHCVFSLARTERFALVIDDYEFLVAAHRGISELICAMIESRSAGSRLMLVICGSSEVVMKREALGYDSPFHGWHTEQIQLQPFTFFETKHYYSDFSPFDIAVIYGITGGVPRYLEIMDPGLPVETNIMLSFFDASSFLLEEPSNILRREVRDPAYYNAVLRAIAAGCTKNSDISAAVGLETSACTAYLKNLNAMGLVGKHTPVTEKAGKKTVYELEDSMFRFWYRFVPDNMALIQSGNANGIWRGVAREIPDFMHKVFEEICRQWVHLRNDAGRLPVKFAEIGRWWGVDPVRKADAAVPIVAYMDDSHALFGDCVWSDEPVGADVLVSLEERSWLFRYPDRYLFLFSCSGFTEDCVALAHRIGANLVMFE